jgi:excisionase family DNA binding protein
MPSTDASTDAVPDRSARKLLDTEQAADYLGVSVRTIKTLMSDGQLPYVKIGRCTRLDAADLDDFISRHRRKQRRRLRGIS